MTHNVGAILSTSSDVISRTFGDNPFAAILSGGLSIASAAFRPPGRATTPAPAVTAAVSQSAPTSVANVGRGITPAAFRGPGARFGGTGNALSLVGAGGRIGAAIGGGLLTEGISRMFGGSSNGIKEILAEARENINGPVTKNKIIDAAKFCGIETAASTFGLNASQVCLVIVAGRTRRRRGISAADIRRTKRVIRFNKRLTKDLKVR